MVNEITGCIMAAASVVAYIIGEGLADAASAKGDYIEGDTYFNGIPLTNEDEEESEV